MSLYPTNFLSLFVSSNICSVNPLRYSVYNPMSFPNRDSFNSGCFFFFFFLREGRTRGGEKEWGRILSWLQVEPNIEPNVEPNPGLDLVTWRPGPEPESRVRCLTDRCPNLDTFYFLFFPSWTDYNLQDNADENDDNIFLSLIPGEKHSVFYH